MIIFLTWTLLLSWICSGSNSLLQPRVRAPVFTQEPLSTIALKGRPVTLNCKVDGNPPPKIQWTRNGELVPLPGDTRRVILPSGSLHISYIINDQRNKPDAGEYQCIATNQVGTTVSRKVNLSVAALSKRFREHPRDETAVESTTARFSCKTRKAIPEPTVTWQKDGILIDTTDKRFVTLPQGVLQISNVRKSDEGKYRCVAKNIAKTRYSNYASLSVQRVPKSQVVGPNFIVPPSNTTTVRGQTAILECVTTGRPRPQVTWKKHGDKQKLQDVPGRISRGISYLKIMTVTEKDSGQYECVATAAGKTITRSAWLFVKEPPHLKKKPKQEVTRQEGLPVQLSCSATGYPHPRITWLKDGRVLRFNDRISVFRGTTELKIRRANLTDSGVYQCFAENDVGNGQVSWRVKVRRSIRPPPKPTNVKITPLSPTKIHLTWTRPVFSYPIIAYGIHCWDKGDTSGREIQEVSNDNNSTSYTLSSSRLKPNTEYSCFVRAYSQKGIGEDSDKVKVKTLEDAPKGAPQNVEVASNTPDSLDVSWDPPAKSDLNGVVTHYYIRYGKTGQPTVSAVYVPGTDQRVTINRLDKGATYDVQVAAQTTGGLGQFSKKISGTVLLIPNQVISAPLFAKSELNSTAVRVVWSAPLYGAKRVVEYRLYYTKNGDNTELGPIKVSKPKREYVLNGLVPNSKYSVKLYAWDGKNAGKPATIIVRTMSVPVGPSARPLAPRPPENVLCNAGSSSSLSVTWQEPDYERDIAMYIVRYEIKGNKNKAAVKTKSTSSKSVHLTGLLPGREYIVTVQSQRRARSAEPGPFSPAAENCITPEAKPSSPPLNVRFQYMTSMSVELLWEAPEHPNGKLTKYRILYSQNKSLSEKHWQWMETTPMFDISFFKKEKARLTALTPNATYYVRIKAGNDAGYGPPSELITIKMKMKDLGSPLHNITIVTHKQSADVYWSKPNGSKSKLEKYILYYSNDPLKSDDWWQKEVLDLDVGFPKRQKINLHIKLLNLTPGATYFVKMRAEYFAGFGPWSDTVKFTMPGGQEKPTASPSPGAKRKPEEQSASEEFAVKLGIIIGCLITAFFFILLVLFVIWRNPCRYGNQKQAQKQDLQLGSSKLHVPGNSFLLSASQQIVYPKGLPSQGGHGLEESSLSSNGVCKCQCHLLHRPPPRNLKPPNQSISNGRVQTLNGNAFVLNGGIPVGSISSNSINSNGNVSQFLNGGVNGTNPPEVRSVRQQQSIRTVVIERRTNSQSISVDV